MLAMAANGSEGCAADAAAGCASNGLLETAVGAAARRHRNMRHQAGISACLGGQESKQRQVGALRHLPLNGVDAAAGCI